MDVAKLKVVELRSELAKRGLDQKGVKSVLVARLQEALETEEKGDDDDVPLASSRGDEGPEEETEEPTAAADESAHSAASSEHDASHQGEDSSQFVSYQEESESKPAESEVNEDSVYNVAEESSDPIAQREEESGDSGEQVILREEASRDSSAAVTVDEASVQSALGEVSNDEPEPVLQDEPSNPELVQIQEPIFDQNSSSNIQEQEQESLDTWNQQESNSVDVSQQPSFHLEDSNAQDALDAEPTLRATEENKEIVETMEVDEKKPEVSQTEEDVKPPTPEKKPKREEREPRERRKNRWDTADEVKEEPQPLMQEIISEPPHMETELEQKVKEEAEERDRKWSGDGEGRDGKERGDRGERGSRKRERSPERRHSSPPPRRIVEDEPEYDENAVLLSWYDSDLHVTISKENFCSASLINDDGFGYVWAGVRATYGFEKGKIYYEAKITGNQDTTSLEDEPTPHVLRVGWSVQNCSLQLGEEPLSYGYGGTGKISCDCKFRDYGKPFVVNDVVGCYLNLDSNPIQLSYSLNGENLGVAYNINRDEIKGQAMFPHILSKNCQFAVNFGQSEPWSTPLEDYVNVGTVPLEDRLAGRKRPTKREECEVIMMVGLPGCGKTTWALKYAEEHKEKMYNILGTNALIDKMKVMGMPRRRNYSGRWDGLIAKCTKCLNTLLDIASKRRRNFILDQTNVYPTAQKRKIRGFDGFIRRAVVVVPTDEELKSRTAKREAEEGKDVPDSAVLEMKANFVLPNKMHFDAIEYVELQQEEAEQLVKQYNKEGNDAGYESKFAHPYKRQRVDDGGGYRSGDDRRRGGYGRGGGGGGGRGFGGRPEGRSGPGGYRSGGFGGRGGGGDRGGRFGDRGGRSRFDDRNSPRGGDRGDRPWRDRSGDFSRPRSNERGGWGSGGSRGGRGGDSGGGWRDNRGGSSWGGSNRDEMSPRSGGGGGGGKYERNGRGRDDRPDDKERGMGPRGWNQGGPEGGRGGRGGSNREGGRGFGGGGGRGRGDGQMQAQGGAPGQGNFQQPGWQGYGNQWGQWGQNYNPAQQQQQQQQQWKGYGQQNWNQQGWGGQWGNWNQGYYNQGYPQNWGQTAVAGQTGTPAVGATGDATQQAAAAAPTYAAYGQAGQAAGAWPNYGMGYGAVPGAAGATAVQQGQQQQTAYSSTQKQT